MSGVVATASVAMNVFDGLDDGVFALDAESRLTGCNRAGERLLGRAFDEVAGATLGEACPELRGTALEAALQQAHATGAPAAREFFHARTGVWFEVRILPSAGGVVAFARDVTALKNAEEALRDARKRAAEEQERLLTRESAARQEVENASRLKDEFLATVSHELRTPLNAMLGWVQILRRGALPAERQAHALETIERNARAQGQLIEDLLDVSRIISGKLKLEVAPVPIDAVVEQAMETVRPAADAKGIQLQAVLDSSATIVGDAQRLQQVVWNLLSNAVKFTPRGGRVQVSVERYESSVEIIVADTGQGIPKEFVPHVFDRFRQAEGGITRKMGGLGLGLSIVRHLVEMHGGVVGVASEGEGRGAAFTVRLPLAVASRIYAAPSVVAERLATGAPFEDPGDLGGLRILVVDDEADARELLREILEGSKARVITASSAAEGFDALVTERPDLIVSDIGMPGADGYSFMARVRTLAPEEGGRTPAVAVTAYARVEDRARAMLAGFQSHLAKPVEPVELLAVLTSLSGRALPKSPRA